MVTFDAFGVRFTTTFPLPEIDGDLAVADAVCTVRLAAPDEPAERFSGPCEPEAVAVSVLGDGRRSRVERGRDGDHLLGFDDEASLWLAPERDVLACAPRDEASAPWRRYLLDTGLGFVSLARGHEGLHAGAVVAPGGGVLAVAAGEGGGKSTLLVELTRRGLPLFTDDLLMLRPAGDDRVTAHPGPPLMNLPPLLADGTAATSVGRVLADLDGESWLAIERPPVAAGPVMAVVLLERGTAGELTVERMPASPMTLLPHSLQGGTDRTRMRARFETCASLASTAAIVQVRAPSDTTASATADALLARLGVRG